MACPTNRRPLCVYLDGTLIRTDLLVESALRLLRESPLTALAMPFWLLRGKATLKDEIARRVDLRVDLLPFDTVVVDYAKSARAAGRRLILATASHKKYAEQVSGYLGIFDAVFASDETENLSGRAKASRLAATYGDGQFDYIGDSTKDVEVWRKAGSAQVARPGPGVLAALRLAGVEHEVLSPQAKVLAPLIRALRPHQWLKNLLVFLPLLTAHRYTDATAIAACVAAFVAFSLAASAGYVVNDLLDLEADRQHPRKRSRPFASGTVPLSIGLVAAPLLALASIGIGVLLPGGLLLILALYLLVTLAYSLNLKRRSSVDVLVLAGLYTLRVIGGTAAIAVPFSFWLLAFSMFLFLSLAFVKRFAELKLMESKGENAAPGRSYEVGDLDLVRTLGVSAGFGAVLVMALYINSPEIRALYHHPQLVWLICPVLLYWVSRIWLIAHRGQMHDDPLVFAAGDRITQLSVLLSAAIIWLAS